VGALVPGLEGPTPSAVIDVPSVSTELSWDDRLGALRVRLGTGRYSYRVDPGLYRVGTPDASSPVLVTANYKLTFDALRSELAGLDVWLLVLDTKGINVWCAAGKGTFGTREVCRRIVETGLHDVVAHRVIVVPQLGAPGVAAHEVAAFTEFRVVYGPVRAADIPAFLAAGMKTTDDMRRVTFPMRERFVLTGVELSVAWRPRTLAAMAAVVAASSFAYGQISWWGLVNRGGTAALAAVGGLVAGGFVTPLLLPWVPGRAFALKGVTVGSLFALALAAFAWDRVGALAAPAAAIALVVIASYSAMNFTGTTTFTSPSGVEHEMRRALPWQIAGATVAVALWLLSAFI
jgi:hypothetical protein